MIFADVNGNQVELSLAVNAQKFDSNALTAEQQLLIEDGVVCGRRNLDLENFYFSTLWDAYKHLENLINNSGADVLFIKSTPVNSEAVISLPENMKTWSRCIVKQVGNSQKSIISNAGSVVMKLGIDQQYCEMLLTDNGWDTVSVNPPNRICVVEQQDQGIDGGSCLVGPNTRVLNTIIEDSGGDVVGLDSNQLEIGSGSYKVVGAIAPHYNNESALNLFNVTDSVYIANGISGYSVGYNVQNCVSITPVYFTTSKAIKLELIHYCEYARATNGLGEGSLSASGKIHFSRLMLERIV